MKESWLKTEYKNFKQEQHVRAVHKKLRKMLIQADRRVLKEKPHQAEQNTELSREM